MEPGDSEFERFYHCLKDFLQARTRDADEADSVALSVLASYLRGKREGRYQEVDSSLGLLCTIAKMKLIRRRSPRTQKGGKGKKMISLDRDLPVEDEQLSEVEAREEARKLWDAVMARLPNDDYRTIFKMNLDEETHKQKVIARELKVSEKTIRNKEKVITKVLEELKDELERRE